MTCEVRNKEINSQCAELLVRPLYITHMHFIDIKKAALFIFYILAMLVITCSLY